MPQDKIMEEIKKTLTELAESQKKTDEEIISLSKEVKNVSKIVKDLTEKTDKEAEELHKMIKDSAEKTKKEAEEVHKMIKDLTGKTDEEIDKVNKMVGDLTDGWGKFVVGLTEPSISDEFKKLGFEVLSIDSPPPRRLDGRELEVDLLIISKLNDRPKVIVVEVKSSINQQKLDKFINRLSQFKRFFFEYKDIELIGGVAGVRFASGIKELVLQYGLYLFSTSKGMMRNITPAGFEPKVW